MSPLPSFGDRRPWWEPHDAPKPTLTLTGGTRLRDADTPSAPAHAVEPAPAHAVEPAAVHAIEPIRAATPGAARRSAGRPTTPLSRPGITARGAFVVMTGAAALGCVVGFLTSGAVAIGPAAGWGLVLGSVFAGLKASPKLGWFPAFLPPLAMLTVIVVLGQVTIVGSRPTVVREFAMIAAGLTATAPAQLVSVAAVAGIVWVRLRRLGIPRSAGR